MQQALKFITINTFINISIIRASLTLMKLSKVAAVSAEIMATP